MSGGKKCCTQVQSEMVLQNWIWLKLYHHMPRGYMYLRFTFPLATKWQVINWSQTVETFFLSCLEEFHFTAQNGLFRFNVRRWKEQVTLVSTNWSTQGDFPCNTGKLRERLKTQSIVWNFHTERLQFNFEVLVPITTESLKGPGEKKSENWSYHVRT